jgi:3-oxoadipate enol-lactonase
MFAEINGIRCFYEFDGEGEEVVALIHALGTGHWMWDRQVEVLRPHFRVLRYDVRGHGQTDKPPGPYSLELFAQDLAALLDVLGIPAAHLVGLSMGGMIAQTFALNYPDRVKSLVLADTSSRYPPESRQQFEERAKIAETQGIEPLIEPALERWFTPEFARAHPEVIERYRRMLRTNDPKAYAAATRAIAQLDLTARLGAIKVPTLVIVGEDDPGTPPAMAKEIAAAIPGARLEILPGRHMTQEESAEAFNRLLLEFLRSVG